MKLLTREQKIKFILAFRFGVYKSSDEFIRYLKDEYQKMQDDELQIEYEFYKGVPC
jgi:hypothetical protein